VQEADPSSGCRRRVGAGAVAVCPVHGCF
jgi:hypothetical protein